MSQSACECVDPGCPVHPGKSECDASPGWVKRTLYRIDMPDEGGTRFCLACADDAEKSGLYTEDEPHVENEP